MPAAPAATTGYRKAVSEKRPVRHLAFDRLPAAVRRCLQHSLAQSGAPRPLVSVVRGPRPPSARRWAFVALGAGLADLTAWIVGFGDRLADPALSPAALAVLHAAAISVGLFAIVYSYRIRKRHLGVPYPPGRHLFELDLVEVEGTSVLVTPLDSLQRVEARPGSKTPSIALVFTDGHDVVFEDQPDAEAQARSAQTRIEAGRRLILPDDLARLEQVDPFLELRIGNDWSLAEADSAPAGAPGAPGAQTGQEPLVERAPLAAVVATAALVGALAGAGMFAVGRQHLGVLDEARLQAARDRDDTNKALALEAYIDAGGRHAAEAEEELFELRKGEEGHLAKYVERGGPRGELAERLLFELQRRNQYVDGLAEHVKRGGRFAADADDALFEMAKDRHRAGAFELYLQKGKRHAAEVESTLLPEAVFAEAVQSGTPTAFLMFVDRYPQSPHAADAKVAIHKLYSNALQDYVDLQQPTPSAHRFIGAMLASIEARNDPSVVLMVENGDPAAIAAADKAEMAVDANHYEEALPRLTGSASGPRASLEAWLQASFPRGLVRAVAPGIDADGTLPRFKVVVTPLADGPLVSQRERVKFTNVRFRIDFKATLPGRPEQLSWSVTTAGLQSFDFTVKASESNHSLSDPDDFARQVYGRMLAEIDRLFQERLEQQL